MEFKIREEFTAHWRMDVAPVLVIETYPGFEMSLDEAKRFADWIREGQ